MRKYRAVQRLCAAGSRRIRSFWGESAIVKVERWYCLKVLDSGPMNDLEAKYRPLLETVWPEEYSFKDQFKKLIITVLFQDKSNANTIRAYRALTSKFEVISEVLASAYMPQLKEAI